jgi:hypothetical protein
MNVSQAWWSVSWSRSDLDHRLPLTLLPWVGLATGLVPPITLAPGGAFSVAINGQPVLSARDMTGGQADIVTGAMTRPLPTQVRVGNLMVTPAR